MKRILLISLTLFIAISCVNNTSRDFFVDPQKGDDNNIGSVEEPFKSIDKVLQVVNNRVERGIHSDKIFLRGGIYRKNDNKTLYHLNLKGTPSNYAMLSAMPCDPGTPGGVQRKSGQWYEKVIIDDGYRIKTKWERVPGDSLIWMTKPGFHQLQWTHKNLWPWTTTKEGFPVTPDDDTPFTTSFTVAPYMLLQDNEPSLWVQSLEDITDPGVRTYNQHTGILYLRPIDDKDPNTCKIETWYGGPEEYDIGTLHLDGEGRAIFDGSLEYATIRGLEFRMFNKLFELHRRGYKNENQRVTQRFVCFEDNYMEYGWIQILLDANTVLLEDNDEFIRPNYEDRSNWLVRNNVYYRPSREVCQLHGDDHVFEYNEVIDHCGPWAGPAACVSVINTRNTRNMKIRYNYIRGLGNTPFHPGKVFMIEVKGGNHVDEKGDYIFGGQTYENNIIADVSGGGIFYLGKGFARMQNITIRNNVFINNPNDNTIMISSPQQNLIVENNIFYNQYKPFFISTINNKHPMHVPPLPSSISISKNIFMKNKNLIDEEIFNYPEGSEIKIDSNLFFENEEKAFGDHIIDTDPLFIDPENFDFRIKDGSLAIQEEKDIGVYDLGTTVIRGTEWWQIKKTAMESLPLNKYRNNKE